MLLYLNLHSFGLHHIYLISETTPHLVVHHSHATDGVVRFPQVEQVVVGQIPLPIWNIKLKKFKKVK